MSHALGGDKNVKTTADIQILLGDIVDELKTNGKEIRLM